MYLSFYKRKKRRTFKITLLILFSVTGILSLVYLKKIPEKPEIIREETIPAAEQKNEQTVREGPMHITYIYSCGHRIEEHKPIPSSYIGKTPGEIISDFSGVEHAGFESGTLTVSVHIASECDNHYTAKLYGNVIRIFPVGNPDTPVKEITVDLKYFYNEEINELKEGISLNSREEVLEFLENYQS